MSIKECLFPSILSFLQYISQESKHTLIQTHMKTHLLLSMNLQRRLIPQEFALRESLGQVKANTLKNCL